MNLTDLANFYQTDKGTNISEHREFNSSCVDNEILNRYKDQIKSAELINNKLLVIQKV